MLLGGWLADRIPHRFADPIQGRRYIGVAGLPDRGRVPVRRHAVRRPRRARGVLERGDAARCTFTLPNWWSVAIPQGGRHTATIFGLMNGLGVIGAMASQGFVGVYADWQKSLGREGRAAGIRFSTCTWGCWSPARSRGGSTASRRSPTRQTRHRRRPGDHRRPQPLLGVPSGTSPPTSASRRSAPRAAPTSTSPCATRTTAPPRRPTRGPSSSAARRSSAACGSMTATSPTTSPRTRTR